MDISKSSINDLLETASSLGQSALVSYVQSLILPHVMEVFAKHDHNKLEAMIRTNYPLVREHTPEGYKRALANLGSNPKFKQQYEQMVLEYVTPENVLEWMRNPDEWLDEEEANEQREELRKCAAVIEETPHGEQWLEDQVLQVYEFAGIVPEDSTPTVTND